MLLLIAIIGGVISGIAATALTVWALSRRAVLDVPNERSSHTSPTIRGGGIGLAAGTLVALAIAHTDLVGSAGIALVIAGLGFGAIGFVDDLTGALPVTISWWSIRRISSTGKAIRISIPTAMTGPTTRSALALCR